MSPTVRGPWLTGKLCPVGILARLDPRHWGGRRVLHFLTGLALAALALVAVDVPAASADHVRPAVVTVAPPVKITPTGPAAPDAARAQRDAAPARGVEPDVGQAEKLRAASHAEALQTASEPASQAAPAVPGAPDVVRQPATVTGTVATPPTGSIPASLGSRAPPLR